jgi:uncharacterized protein
MSVSAAKRLLWRRFVRWLGPAFLMVTIAAVGGIAWLGSEKAIHPDPQVYEKGLADFPGLRPERLTFDSRTGARIAGLFFPGRRRSTIVLSHGYGENKIQMLPYVDFLNKAGFSVFTYDMRSRGESGGEFVTLGKLEQVDLLSAVDYLVSRADVDPERLGAMGVSLGGATTLLAAASDTRIKAVVDDSGFSDAKDVLATSFEHFVGLPSFPFAAITNALVRWRTGVDTSRIRPVDVVARIYPRPLMVVHCMKDSVIPPQHSELNFAAARGPKWFWRIPTGGHIDGLKVAGEEYARRVSQFFDESLR